MTNLIDIETFQATLPACEDYLLHSYISVCQAELKIRSERELELAKNALAKCSKDQLLGVLLHLGIEWPAENQRKPRERKKSALYGFKEYVTEQGEKYHVPKFFNPATQEHCVGSQAVFLQGFSSDEKLEKFGTVNLLLNNTVQLAELVELGLVYTMQDGACVQVTLDMLPAERPELPQEATAAEVVQPKAGRRVRRQEAELVATE